MMMTRKEMVMIADLVVERLKAEGLVSQERTLSASGAAEYLGVSVKTVYNLTSTGDLPCRKIGKRNVYTERSLWEYLHR